MQPTADWIHIQRNAGVLKGETNSLNSAMSTTSLPPQQPLSLPFLEPRYLPYKTQAPSGLTYLAVAAATSCRGQQAGPLLSGGGGLLPLGLLEPGLVAQL